MGLNRVERAALSSDQGRLLNRLKGLAWGPSTPPSLPGADAVPAGKEFLMASVPRRDLDAVTQLIDKLNCNNVIDVARIGMPSDPFQLYLDTQSAANLGIKTLAERGK